MRPCMTRCGARMLAALILASLLSACASTPQASRERDSEAKKFGSSPAMATLYVYRTDTYVDDSVLWVDGRLIGATLPYTFFRIHLDPGEHLLTGMAADNGRLKLRTRPGAIYFVALTVSAGQSHFQQVPAETGRKVVANCCYLLENWAPGQRPLIR
jgi:hypothetical protein